MSAEQLLEQYTSHPLPLILLYRALGHDAFHLAQASWREHASPGKMNAYRQPPVTALTLVRSFRPGLGSWCQRADQSICSWSWDFQNNLKFLENDLVDMPRQSWYAHGNKSQMKLGSAGSTPTAKILWTDGKTEPRMRTQSRLQRFPF